MPLSMPKSRGDSSDRELEAEIRELERDSARMPGVIVAIFLGIAILCLGIAAVLTASAVRRLAREVRAPGYVVDMVARRDQQGNDVYYPVVTFSLPDGTPKTVQVAEGSWPPAHVIDEEVTVAYDPQRPLSARIASDGSVGLIWIGPLITALVGLAFLGVVLLVRGFFAPEPAKDGAEQT
jgi:hypothetical protein